MTKIDEIETPTLVIDEQIALANIAAFQAHCDAHGLALRPHIKTHKTVHFAQAQLAAGASGITCQKIGEAEVMADGGIDDILLTYNILGEAKLKRLFALAGRVRKLAVVADNLTVIDGLSATFADAPKPLRVLIECDTGAARCGVQTAEEAGDLAMVIQSKPGLSFGGLMTYPANGGQDDVTVFMAAALQALQARNIACPIISAGGSPDMWSSTGGIVSEYRIGTYIYNDRSLVERGTCGLEDCAATVLATVVSTPAPGRAVIDAGSKVLTSDLLGLDGHGHIIGHPDARIAGLSEEHGVIDAGPEDRFMVGDRLRIIPNHICVVSNMLDSVWLQNAKGTLTAFPIDARGRVF